MRVLVTGASGLVGAALLCRLLREPDISVRACARVIRPDAPSDIDWVSSPDLRGDSDWTDALSGVDAVVHLAARVHMMASGAEADRDCHRVNVRGTQRLAEQAAAAGVRRFVFLSSIKVHGEYGALSETSPLAPVDAYGSSKRDAEVALLEIGRRTQLEVVIIRPPLVYGPGVKANFRALLAAVQRGIPLPLASVCNRRSLVAVDNLVDLIRVCLTNPAAVSEVFLVSDGEDLSTPELIRRLAAASGRRARLLPVPGWGLALLAAVAGRTPAVRRLTGSLSVDISKARRVLGWTPPVSVDEALRRMVQVP